MDDFLRNIFAKFPELGEFDDVFDLGFDVDDPINTCSSFEELFSSINTQECKLLSFDEFTRPPASFVAEERGRVGEVCASPASTENHLPCVEDEGDSDELVSVGDEEESLLALANFEKYDKAQREAKAPPIVHCGYYPKSARRLTETQRLKRNQMSSTIRKRKRSYVFSLEKREKELIESNRQLEIDINRLKFLLMGKL